MPTWLMPVVEWGVKQVLDNLSVDDAKKALALVLSQVSDLVVMAESRLPDGPFKGVEDEVAQKFAETVKELVKALS